MPIAAPSTGSDINVAQMLTQLFAGTPKQTTTTQPNAQSTSNLQGVINTANSNATDPAITQNIINNIMRQSAINFAPQLASGKTAGGYNSETINLLAQQAVANTTNTAASTVLNYQTQQQQIAASASDQLANDSKTTTTATAPVIPTNISQALGVGVAGLSLLNNAKDIKKLVTDPIGTISSKLGITDTPASVGSQSATDSSISNSLGVNVGDTSGTTTSSADAIGTGLASTSPTNASAIAAEGTPTFDTLMSGNAVAPAIADTGLVTPTGADALATEGTSLAATPIDASSLISNAVAGTSGPLNIAGDVGAALSDGGAGTVIGDLAGAGGTAIGTDIAATVGVGSDIAAGTAAAGDAILGAGAAADAGAAAAGGSGLADAAIAAAAAWIICTELVKQGRMNPRWYYLASKSFLDYPEWGKQGYYLWAIPCVKHLRASPTSRFSSILSWVFNKRAQHIVSRRGVAKPTIAGRIIYHSLYWGCGFIAAFICPFFPRQEWKHLYRNAKKEAN